jgi:5-methylcytosine-specific restriction endonuclease McrA
MSSKEYKDLLQDDRWKRKSLKIRNRDFHTCQHCGIKGVELHVHHKRYYPGKKPWEIEDEYLITLCYSCHEKEHKGKSLSSFVVKNKQKQDKLDRKRKRREKKNKIKLNKPVVVTNTPIVQKKVLSHSELKQKLEEHKLYLERIKSENFSV